MTPTNIIALVLLLLLLGLFFSFSFEVRTTRDMENDARDCDPRGDTMSAYMRWFRGGKETENFTGRCYDGEYH